MKDRQFSFVIGMLDSLQPEVVIVRIREDRGEELVLRLISVLTELMGQTKVEVDVEPCARQAPRTGPIIAHFSRQGSCL